jgi:hypothetical protein
VTLRHVRRGDAGGTRPATCGPDPAGRYFGAVTSVQVEIRTGVVIPSDRAELFELFEELRYEPHDVPPIVSRSRQALPLVIWVAENIGAPAALHLGQAVARWLLRERGDRAKEERIQVIYGPNDEELLGSGSSDVERKGRD